MLNSSHQQQQPGLGSLSMAAPGVDVLLPATALTVALAALDEVQRDDLLETAPVDELPREKLTKSTKILELIKTILIASKRRLQYRPASKKRVSKKIRLKLLKN